MAGINIKLKSGSFAGAVIPVDLDLAYTPDRVDADTSITGKAYVYYDETVLQAVTGPSFPGSVDSTTGTITWSPVTVAESGAWTKLSVHFQWIDYTVDETVIHGAFNSRETGLVTAEPLEVIRPTVAKGTKLKSSS